MTQSVALTPASQGSTSESRQNHTSRAGHHEDVNEKTLHLTNNLGQGPGVQQNSRVGLPLRSSIAPLARQRRRLARETVSRAQAWYAWVRSRFTTSLAPWYSLGMWGLSTM